MKLELLISAVNADPKMLIEKMKILGDAVLINQCGKESEETLKTERGEVKVLSFDEKGVGLSRNRAIENSSADIILFSDDDIVYDFDYEATVLNEFAKHPEADCIFFNVEVCEERRTYYNQSFGPVHLWNGGRYPAYSIAMRRDSLVKSGVKFSLLFGGGAKYSCGEDSLFIKDCIESGLKLFKTPALIGKEEPRENGESTWFKGYDKKFFYDRGVLYAFLYGPLAKLFGFRFVFTKRNVMCREIPWQKCYKYLKDGISKGNSLKA